MDEARPQILIVDDHKLFGDVLKVALIGAGHHVVGIATDARQALDRVRQDRPELVLVDMRLPDQSGLSLGRAILKIFGGCKVVAVTAVEEPRLVRETVAAGFRGYIPKSIPITQFMARVKAVLAGGLSFPTSLEPHRVDGYVPGNGNGGGDRGDGVLLISQLTPRELEVVALLTEGLGGDELARRLRVTRHTVRTHIQNIFSKLQLHSRVEVVAFAAKHGLRPPRPHSFTVW
jgi:DNA-binding NarL/FixJ family response regulator